MQVHSIFESISGEAGFFPQGTWCTFIRLQGCNLRCSWCDTVTAQTHDIRLNYEMTINNIVKQIKTRHVLITGGEPLARNIEDFSKLLRALSGYVVQVETNGSLKPPEACEWVKWVVDYKCPSSGMIGQMLPVEQFIKVWPASAAMVKFVVANGADLQRAIAVMQDMRKTGYIFLVSPLNGDGHQIPAMVVSLRHAGLLDQIIFSVQLHKLLGLE